MERKTNASIRLLIYTLSVLIPIVVTLLFRIKIKGYDFSFLPPLYASINALCALVLIAALIAIRNQKIALHRMLMLFALTLSLLFLIGYILYHMTAEATAYVGGYGFIYYPLLISHILLSVVVIPLVLFTALHAIEGNYAKHKKWARFAWPIWFYVAISGVLVYLMIAPYYS